MSRKSKQRAKLRTTAQPQSLTSCAGLVFSRAWLQAVDVYVCGQGTNYRQTNLGRTKELGVLVFPF